MEASRPLVLLCTDDPASRAIYHRLRAEVGHVVVVQEPPLSRARLLRRRFRRLGPIPVLGQLLFAALAMPVLEWRSAGRIEEIKQAAGMDDSPFESPHLLPSVNSDQARHLLQTLDPALVIVCGTRILAPETIRAVRCPMVNYHAGITPLYRGVHGGYWALAEGRRELVGSTVHFVDEGIDTGAVIEQRTFEVTARDTFATYPYLHVAAALPVLVSVARQALGGERITSRSPATNLPSKLRTHPTLWGYLGAALREHVR